MQRQVQVNSTEKKKNSVRALRNQVTNTVLNSDFNISQEMFVVDNYLLRDLGIEGCFPCFQHKTNKVYWWKTLRF